jgi:hypothetical protein
LRDARAERAVQVELEAVGVAMSLGVKGVANLAQEAPRIVRAAKALVEHEGAPPTSELTEGTGDSIP